MDIKFRPKQNEQSSFLNLRSKNNVLKLIPLGGVGDVTKNMYVYEYGNDIIIVDCGVGFPDEGMPGVDLVIPDISYLRDKRDKIKAILVTHGHEDHIGALPFIWPELQVPIYTRKLTAGFIKNKFTEQFQNEIALLRSAQNKIFEVKMDDKLTLGAFQVSFYEVSHSVPDSMGIFIKTPVGNIIHQSDFKIDWTPVSGQVTDVQKIAQIAKDGIDLLLIDCLRVEKPGFNKSESSIQGSFLAAAEETPGKLLITTTSSNVSRMQQAINVAVKTGRKVSLAGRSFESNFQVARDLGYLDVPPNLVVASDALTSYTSQKVLVLIAGAQGQPGSALSRAANGEHKQVKLQEGDAVLFSADAIPGSETAQGAMIDNLTKQGINVYYSAITSDLHVSVLPHTEVLIKDKQGRVKLAEIQNIEDEVLAYSFDRKYCTSSWKESKKIRHEYKGLTYKITTSTGRFVEVTEGHSLFVLRNAQILEVKSENLQVGDYLVTPKRLPLLESEQAISLLEFLPKQKGYLSKDGYIFYNGFCISPTRLALDNEFSRLLGYYLAEGSAPRHLSIVLNANEVDLAEEIKELINKLLKVSINTQTRLNAHEITFGTPFLGKIFKDWFGERATLKRIPWFMLNATEEQKLNFLGAYINGDGGIDKGAKHSRIRIKTASKKLASDLLYLFAGVGIIARLDHMQNNPARFIGKQQLKATQSYVVRIQGKDYISKLLPYLSKKFQDYFDAYYLNDQRVNFTQTHSPEALPVLEINLPAEVTPRRGSTLAGIYHAVRLQKIPSQMLINTQIIERDAEVIGNPLKYYLSGDVLFDPIKKIETENYEGFVYDLSVPGPENFLGGFGGIFLHNSGHAAADELKLMVNLIKAKNILPIGGTFRHMKFFSKMCQEMGYEKKAILDVIDGDVINLSRDGVKIDGRVEVRNVFVDGLGVGDVGSVVLRDRQLMSEEGVVIVVLPIGQQSGRLEGEPDIISRGFVFEQEAEGLLDEARVVVRKSLEDHGKKIADWRFMRRMIEDELERFLYHATERRPLILPIVVEV